MKPSTVALTALGAAMAILTAAAANASKLSDEMWLDLPSGLVVVQALESARNSEPCAPADPDREGRCWYDYSAYRWQPAGDFHLLLSMESSDRIDTANSPLSFDLGLIADRIAEVDAKESLRPEAQPHSLYDRRQWVAVSDTAMDLGPGLHFARVLVLRSRASTGSSAYGEALFDVQVMLLDGDRVLHRSQHAHEPNAPNPVYFTSAQVRVRDVTGDHVPEILYSTSFLYVTDYATKEHILHRRGAASTAFRDVTPENFLDLQHGPFKWLERDGEVLAVQATAAPPKKGEDWTAGADKPYIYEVYCWDSARERFTRMVRVEGTEARQWDGRQIDDDMPLIERALQGHASKPNGPRRRVVSSPGRDPQPPTPAGASTPQTGATARGKARVGGNPPRGPGARLSEPHGDAEHRPAPRFGICAAPLCRSNTVWWHRNAAERRGGAPLSSRRVAAMAHGVLLILLQEGGVS